jgi:hypothetical protein
MRSVGIEQSGISGALNSQSACGVPREYRAIPVQAKLGAARSTFHFVPEQQNHRSYSLSVPCPVVAVRNECVCGSQHLLDFCFLEGRVGDSVTAVPSPQRQDSPTSSQRLGRNAGMSGRTRALSLPSSRHTAS